jgi:2-polyprenyl-3-methyl-5-hydroxy-6-metoxy-1,4-benzoquinol methylase
MLTGRATQWPRGEGRLTQRLVRKPEGYFEIEPRPTPEELAAYYRDKYFVADHGKNPYAHGYTEEELQHKYLQPAETELVWARAPGRLLEVGVGEGFTLDYLVKRGCDAGGLDFTDDGIQAFFPELADKLRLGDAFALLGEVIARGETFDLIICNNVLEHVIDPMGLLHRLRAIVAPEGMVRISVPNDGSWLQDQIVRRGLAEPEFWLAPPDHLNYFNTDSLPKAMAACGWQVVEHLGEFPIDIFLLNPDTGYMRDRSKGRACHFARIAFEMGLWKERCLEAVVEFRRGCARAGVGRNQTVYARPAGR